MPFFPLNSISCLWHVLQLLHQFWDLSDVDSMNYISAWFSQTWYFLLATSYLYKFFKCLLFYTIVLLNIKLRKSLLRSIYFSGKFGANINCFSSDELLTILFFFFFFYCLFRARKEFFCNSHKMSNLWDLKSIIIYESLRPVLNVAIDADCPLAWF